jgi:hypothetical protein
VHHWQSALEDMDGREFPAVQDVAALTNCIDTPNISAANLVVGSTLIVPRFHCAARKAPARGLQSDFAVVWPLMVRTDDAGCELTGAAVQVTSNIGITSLSD